MSYVLRTVTGSPIHRHSKRIKFDLEFKVTPVHLRCPYTCIWKWGRYEVYTTIVQIESYTQRIRFDLECHYILSSRSVIFYALMSSKGLK